MLSFPERVRAQFGLERMQAFWSTCVLEPTEAIEGIMEEIHAFTGETPQEDDQTIAVIFR